MVRVPPRPAQLRRPPFKLIHRQVGVQIEGLRRPDGALPVELFVKITDKDGGTRPLLRFGAELGATQPGRRFWSTNAGRVRGHNLRVGSPWSPHCLTMRVHWRAKRRTPDWKPA